ncbi:MAG: tRNA preQ1(34) S-adenosylmethionine ribosyltransferase-isomerase QueA [bacterium]
MKTSDFDYNLPPERIAQTRLEPPDSSRLLVLDKKTGAFEHRIFAEIGKFLRAGDLLVVNDTKVFRARLHGTVDGKKLEIFLVRPHGDSWVTLVKPRKKLKLGSVIDLGFDVSLSVLALPEDGTAIVKPSISDSELIDFANAHGEIPVPPYIERAPEKLEGYQTIFARETGSVAAPTAAFHFTPRLIEELKKQGIEFASITLHVGLGTFQPIKVDDLSNHPMHEEWVEISKETTEKINLAKREGRRVIAVGTTTTRALEGVAARCHLGQCCHPEAEGSCITAFSGDVNIFITPGFEFKIIDGLITNFHLPKSTLLALVSALAGRENIMRAYEEAIELKYRFFSFGDAMFIR